MRALVWTLIFSVFSLVALGFSVYWALSQGDYDRGTYNLVLAIWMFDLTRRQREEVSPRHPHRRPSRDPQGSSFTIEP